MIAAAVHGDDGFVVALDFFVWARNEFLRRNFGEGVVVAELDHNQANITSGTWIFDDLNNGQLPANSQTLLYEYYATRICNQILVNLFYDEMLSLQTKAEFS